MDTKKSDLVPAKTTESDLTTALANIDVKQLDLKVVQLINQVCTEEDEDKQKELINLFNNYHKKKILAQTTKLDSLVDIAAEKLYKRLVERSDEVTTVELNTILKTAADLADRRTKAATEEPDVGPLIQINEQKNEVNVNSEKALEGYSRDSRNKVKAFVGDVLQGIIDNTPEVVDAQNPEEDK